MPTRTRTTWSPLAVVFLVVLGLGMFCGPAAAAQQPVATAVEATAAAEAFAAQAADVQGSPGCGKGTDRDADQTPGTPQRPGTAYELLPALHDTRAASGSWGADQAVLLVAPGRAPPALTPPSPIDLSILRV
ncbi:hypothetical protein [Streptomyces venezuelae]|uniref:Secreted protein n=1 Tax=Streptomyces venezuelae TaxID=54571 RepID=A0A5P2C2I9_STRVZ|nr:hypothetical protein [Streptomyces venezuelae]QES35521.1 hypothetical protein DEJ48_20680 [Streptomyces venezuelae]